MPEMRGTDFMRTMNGLSSANFIFTTAYENYALEGFELQALDGLGELASDVEFFIIESHLKCVFGTKDRFSDLVIKMKEMGFELADLLNVLGHQPVAQDCLFLPKDDVRFRSG